MTQGEDVNFVAIAIHKPPLAETRRAHASTLETYHNPDLNPG